MSNSQYMRSVNDYSLSAHEIFFSNTGNRFPEFTNVFTIENVSDAEWHPLMDKVFKAVENAGFTRYKLFTISYDDGISIGSRDESPAIYEQRFAAYTRDNKWMVVEAYHRSGIATFITLSDIDESKIFKEIFDEIRTAYVPPMEEQVFYTIANNGRGFELERMKIPTDYREENIIDNYNDDFRNVHDLIITSIDTNKKGLILLHGSPGTGKTSYIEQIISRGSNRKIVYIPPHLASSIASPSFISFVRSELSSCVLVIEDGEEILRDRTAFNSDSGAVSNLLNISDGILGKALNILIIATFNMEKEFIDKALMRKGRMICEHFFGPLEEGKAFALAKKLHGENVVFNLKGDECTLANVYNLEVEQPRAKQAPKVQFGFVSGK